MFGQGSGGDNTQDTITSKRLSLSIMVLHLVTIAIYWCFITIGKTFMFIIGVDTVNQVNNYLRLQTIAVVR